MLHSYSVIQLSWSESSLKRSQNDNLTFQEEIYAL